MAKVLFGVWDNVVFDNRDRQIFEIEEEEKFSCFDEFDKGNPIKIFFGGHGFFVFEKSANLLSGLSQHMGRVADESCGKCTPCRVGTQIISRKLEKLVETGGTEADFDELVELAEQVHSTSLCGLGQTSTIPLLEAIRYFKETLIEEMGGAISDQPIHSYVSAPCIEACPSKVDVPKYIDFIRDGKFTHSMGVILQKYPMVATCGRVCVRFCEQACRRTQVDEAVGIKTLKRFVADHERDMIHDWFTAYTPSEKKDPALKVAVIGAGPAGISAAYQLLLKGYHVEMFEEKSVPGGMAATGIPEYRLPKEILNQEISIIETLGGKIHYGKTLGRDISIGDLMNNGYKAVFLGIGCHKGKSLRIPYEDPDLAGYDFGVDFLLRLNRDYVDQGLPMVMGKQVVVVGGGNVAMDCARSALRMEGVEEVHLIYRRSEEEMPADHEEIEAAHDEGVIFHPLTNPSRIVVEDGRIAGVELTKMQLGEIGRGGRRTVSAIDDSEYILACDQIIPAIGQQVDTKTFAIDSDLQFSQWGTLQVDENLMTSRRGVFAGGDCVRGPATLIQAMEQGTKAAGSIDDYLSLGRIRFQADERMGELVAGVQPMMRDGVSIPVEHLYRVKVQELDPETRREIFEEVEKPISVDQAYKEANRCMRCYRVYSAITER